ncbi:porin family protein [Paludibacter sp.]
MVKKYISLLIYLLLFSNLSAQGNLTDLDYKIFRLGFSLGTNFMDLKIEHTELEQNGKIYYADVPTLIPGFSVGLITDLRLHRYFNLRCTPSLLLGERNIHFKTFDVNTKTFQDDKTVNLFSLPIDIPVYIRYSAERYGNFKPYVQIGTGVLFDLGRDEQTDITQKLSDLYFGVGVGCDLYFKFFKLSPELKLNVGQFNVLSPKKPTPENAASLVYTNSISKILSRILVFSFNIE